MSGSDGRTVWLWSSRGHFSASLFPFLAQVRGPSENHAGHWERWQSCQAAWISWGQDGGYPWGRELPISLFFGWTMMDPFGSSCSVPLGQYTCEALPSVWGMLKTPWSTALILGAAPVSCMVGCHDLPWASHIYSIHIIHISYISYMENIGFLSQGRWSTNGIPIWLYMATCELIRWFLIAYGGFESPIPAYIIWRETWQKSPQKISKADHKIEQGRIGSDTRGSTGSTSICFEYARSWRLPLIVHDVPFSFQKPGGHGDCSRMWSRMHGNTGPGRGEMDDQIDERP